MCDIILFTLVVVECVVQHMVASQCVTGQQYDTGDTGNTQGDIPGDTNWGISACQLTSCFLS